MLLCQYSPSHLRFRVMNPMATYCGMFVSDLERDDPYHPYGDSDSSTKDQLSGDDADSDDSEQERLSKPIESSSPLSPAHFYDGKTGTVSHSTSRWLSFTSPHSSRSALKEIS